MTHTEHVHIFYGLGLVLIGGLWLASLANPVAALRYSWAILVTLLGLSLVIATETQARTYQQVGPWDTFVSVIPNSLEVWLETVRKPHVVQHKLAGVCALAAGLVEWGRAAGRLRHRRWGLALPVLALGAALAIGVHGGSSRHLPRVAEQAHHWMLGLGLVLGAATYAYGLGRRRRRWLTLLPTTLILVGMSWVLGYRLPGDERSPAPGAQAGEHGDGHLAHPSTH